MKKNFEILVCFGLFLALLCLAATTVLPGLQIRDYPNDSNPPDSAAYILDERPTAGTNKHVLHSQLRFRITNGLATVTYVNSLTNYASRPLLVLTNGVSVGVATQLNFVNGITGLVAIVGGLPEPRVTIGLSSAGSISGSTNYLNLSVQAAKLPSTNYPGIDAGWQDWELIYYKTNAEGVITSLNSSWQFIVPQDYATNSMVVRIYSTLASTNGPNTSNTIFRVSVLRATPSDAAVDLHTNVFGASLSGTNTWTASYVGTNKMQSVSIALGTNSMLAAGDLCLLKLDRDSSNDTFGGASSVVGLQLQHTRQ